MSVRTAGNPTPAAVPATLVVDVEMGTSADATAVAVVDGVEAALGAPGTRRDGEYDRAWVLLRRGGHPVRDLDVPLPATVRQVAEAVSPFPAARDDRAPVADADLPSISVVVPTVVGRHDELDRCLASLADLRYPSFEVIVVDNRPIRPVGDVLPGLLAQHPLVRVLHEPRPGISAARNAGLAAATGEVVAFTDDDVRVDRGWLLALGARFAARPEEDVVTGLVVPEELLTPAQRAYETHYGGFGGQRAYAPVHVRGVHPERPGTVTEVDARGQVVRTFAVYGIGAFGAGANMAFRRDALLALGGFDVRLGTGTPARGGEDLAALIDVLWRGGNLGYEPSALVHHTHRREMDQLERQLRGNGTGFTAMLTSLVVKDVTHGRVLARLLPGAVATMVRQAVQKISSPRTSSGPSQPPRGPGTRRLVVLELSGMPLGPMAYYRSRSVDRARRLDAAREGRTPPVPGDLVTPRADAGLLTVLRPRG